MLTRRNTVRYIAAKQTMCGWRASALIALFGLFVGMLVAGAPAGSAATEAIPSASSTTAAGVAATPFEKKKGKKKGKKKDKGNGDKGNGDKGNGDKGNGGKSAGPSKVKGLPSCLNEGVVLQAGSQGACVLALQYFLRYTVNYRGYGPICDEGTIKSYPIQYTCVFDARTAQHLDCYQQMVSDHVEWGSGPYTTPLPSDGNADSLDLGIMVNMTCAADEQFLYNGAKHFGNRWFCTI